MSHSKLRILISKQKYINILNDIGKLASKSASKMIEPKKKLKEAEVDADVNKEMYARVVGRLIYFSHTRLAIDNIMS